ncbi:xanthine dehydrogenase accessory protein XdhC [Parasalinivibrio latis]|uniref:xanthine dehydrogenase accessory protein XdhC n=1 Tax=Parasalinivibrio latis TaxID=2952610 RepID=UPI0030DF166B
MFKDNWIQALAGYEQRGEPCVMVTVLEDRGSVPRDAGTKMLVTRDELVATIGGGHLEHLATEMARDMMSSGERQMKVERFNLGARLGQCCGGVVTLSFEPIVQQKHHLALFGAGHVAKALVHVLATLPIRVTWVDERDEQFPEELPPNVHKVVTDDPVGDIADMPKGSMYLVMTHNHQLDFELSRAILLRGDSKYFGLIGSLSKRKRFDHKLRERGHAESDIHRMICPIGIGAVSGKHPAEIAVSVAGELIACYQGQDIKSKRPPSIAAETGSQTSTVSAISHTEQNKKTGAIKQKTA